MNIPRASESADSSNPSADRPWYDQSFGAEYLELYKRRDRNQARVQVDDLADWLRLQPGDQILDLCCGAGRHLEYLAERQFNVLGLDRSGALLEEARRSLARSVPLVRADMRRLPFDCRFDAVVSFFTSFGYFPSREQDGEVAREVARVLRPGGSYVLDLMDPGWTRDHLVLQSARNEAGKEIRERRWILDDETGGGPRVEKETVVRDSAGERRFEESVRLYTFAELTELLREQGFEATDARADFTGEAYVPGAGPRMMVRALRSGS